ncbi:MAG: hypothetical protein ACT6RZ_02120 [Methylophilus sp.]|uniref:hypothetical protein n=1 Tax=Methylophilus sp. TaxID=29541 RepID=UPI004035EFB5
MSRNRGRDQIGLLVGLWIIAVYTISLAVANLLGHILRVSGLLYLTSDQEQYWNNMPLPMGFMAILLITMNLVGGVFLIQRRKIALHILLISLGINIILLLQLIGASGIPASTSVGLLVLHYGFRISVVGYVYLLDQKNVLSK